MGLVNNCPDCWAEPGSPHVDGCDVARCTECGYQRISCKHEDSDVGWGSIWTGTWPGVEECEEFNLYSFWDRGWHSSTKDAPGASHDLNTLMAYASSGRVVWDIDKQRWVKRVF